MSAGSLAKSRLLRRSVTFTWRHASSGAYTMNRFAVPLRPCPEPYAAGCPGRGGSGVLVSPVRRSGVPSMTARTVPSSYPRLQVFRTSSMAQTDSALSFGGMHQHSLRQGLMSFFNPCRTVPSGMLSTTSSPPSLSPSSRSDRRACPSGGSEQASIASLAWPPPSSTGFLLLACPFLSRAASRPPARTACGPARPSRPRPRGRPRCRRHRVRRRPGRCPPEGGCAPAGAASPTPFRRRRSPAGAPARHRPALRDIFSFRLCPWPAPSRCPHGAASGHPPDPEGLLVVVAAGILHQVGQGRRPGVTSTRTRY